jgi:hypothetical protein
MKARGRYGVLCIFSGFQFAGLGVFSYQGYAAKPRESTDFILSFCADQREYSKPGKMGNSNFPTGPRPLARNKLHSPCHLMYLHPSQSRFTASWASAEAQHLDARIS